eukprot:s963_g47.t1
MREGDGAASGQAVGSSNLPWHLIPKFVPGETDVNEYTRRMEFLANLWPKEHLSQLAPRACLLCEGTAFSKVVRLDPEKLKTADITGVQLLVKTLGGTWGQTRLETKYERFERALYGTVQKPDETHTSYLARHEVQFEELANMKATLEEFRAYILIRNSGLTSEDKKRIIVESAGNLDYDKVVASIKLLGSKFFGEVQAGMSAKTNPRSKTYDVNYVDDGDQLSEEADETAFVSVEASEDAGLEQLLSEGDEDALLIQQFEESLVDSLQSDAEIATCLNTYLEARKRITEKIKGRGFWSSKGSKGFKGRGKNKGGFRNQFRKPLAQRILESTCRICNQKGHWKAECPQRHKTGNANPSSGSSAFAGVTIAQDVMHTSMESMHLDSDDPPEHATAFQCEESCLVTLSWGNGDKIGDKSGINRMKTPTWQSTFSHRLQAVLRKRPVTEDQSRRNPLSQNDVASSSEISHEIIQFVSHGTHGIVDLGASMSVIGEAQFQQLCTHLPSEVKHAMKEAPCSVSFRFGNDSTVIGRRAVYFPVGAKWIKVVVVPSNTPFLIANSVFRSLGAVIDVAGECIKFQALERTVPMQLTDRKLFRIDLLDLLQNASQPPAEAGSTNVKFDDLAERLRSLSIAEKETEDISPIMAMTLEELKEERVAFGKAHLGKAFKELIPEVKYLSWFAENYKFSRKPAHVKMLRFIQLHVEDLESQKIGKKGPLQAKAKSKNPPTSQMMVHIDLDDEDDVWDPIPEDQPNPESQSLEMLQMQDRMNQMEHLLQEVLGHLTRQQQQPSAA